MFNGINYNHIECKAQILEIYSNGKGRLFSSTLPMLPPPPIFFLFINILGSKKKKTQSHTLLPYNYMYMYISLQHCVKCLQDTSVKCLLGSGGLLGVPTNNLY